MGRRIEDFKVGTEIIILKATCGWAGVKKGDIGVISRTNKCGHSVRIDFDAMKGWSLNSGSKEGIHFEVVNSDFITF